MTKLVATCIALLACISMNAQGSAKLGYVNVFAIVDSMPQTSVARVKIGRVNDSLVTILEKEQKKLIDLLNNPPANMTNPEMLALQDTFLTHKNDADKYLDSYQSKMLGDIVKKVKDAIADVAKEEGYTYVFDSGQTDCVFSLPSGAGDITALVRKKLGLK